MNVLIHGATGRMGRVLIEKISALSDMDVVASVSPEFPEETENCFFTLDKVTQDIDVLIDFSNHVTTKDVTDFCVSRKIPAVICTTAQTEEEKEMILNAAKEIPVFFSANMSLGIAVLSDLARRAAKLFPDADIEIVEKHHNQKLDVPSGTALMLARSIQKERENAEFVVGRHEYGKRKKEEIGIHSLRLGSEVGTHEIIIATGSETLTLKHEAENRSLFADGAIEAARFVVGREAGLVDMLTLIND